MLTLRYSTTSPYVRKVSVLAIESGLDDQVHNEMTFPWAPDTNLPETNPIGKVPALDTESGKTIFDSPVICEYLDHLGGKNFFPDDFEARIVALRQQAIGDGILDAAVATVMEGKRPENYHYDPARQRFKAAIDRSLDVLEREIDELASSFTIGQITVGCALGYLDFRFGNDDWRPGRPNLSRWYEEIAVRASFQRTVPYDLPA